MTFDTTHNVTSSPESAAGQSHSDRPCGRTIDLFGQEAAPVNRLAPLDKDKARMMNATYGRCGEISLRSADLQSSLESRLQARLPLDGWTKPLMIWRRKTTPAQRQYCQLAVSARLTDGTAYGLWHSPLATMPVEKPENFQRRKNEKRKGDRSENATPNLAVQALWATPNTMDGMPLRSPEAMERMMTDPKARKGRTAPSNLREQVHPSMWPTPSSLDWKDTSGMNREGVNPDGSKRNRMDQLARVIPSNGSSALTESNGQLSPAFVCWLMGYPEGYEKLLYTALETPSTRMSRQSSSRQQEGRCER